MKHKVHSDQKFTPITLEITMETQKEVDAWYSLLIFHRIFQAMSGQGIDISKISADLPCSGDYHCVFDNMKRHIVP